MSEPVTLRLREDGPIVVHGPIRLVGPDGQEIPLPTDKPLVALCRCGRSQGKPFCDGSHRAAGHEGARAAE